MCGGRVTNMFSVIHMMGRAVKSFRYLVHVGKHQQSEFLPYIDSVHCKVVLQFGYGDESVELRKRREYFSLDMGMNLSS